MSHTAEATMRAEVVVTFLRMDRRPPQQAPAWPASTAVRTVAGCSVAQYRRLYNTVGGPYLWWLRRVMPDRELAMLLSRSAVSIHLLTVEGAEAGFYELDATHSPSINLSYFGLMPGRIGQGLGSAFLRHGIDTAFGMGARAVTVNTCTADHPRALPAYLKAGFRTVRQVPETWDVPLSLGLEMPAHLRG